MEERAAEASLGRRHAVALGAAVVLYSAVAMTLAPFSGPQRVATGLACAGVVVLALRHGWHHAGGTTGTPDDEGERHVAALVLWALLIGTAVAVQLFNYVEWPRDVYPTLSSLAGEVFAWYPVRVAGYTAWLTLGWYFLRR